MIAGRMVCQSELRTSPTSEVSLDATAGEDPRALLLTRPMSRLQKNAVGLTVALCALDGFDVLVITFAASVLERQWGIGKAELGYILSAGLLGMAGGSALIAPLADVLGRRKVVFLSLTLMILGTFWTALTGGTAPLICSRVLTGVGIGAMVAVLNPLAAEYANTRYRDFAVSLLNIGYPIGGVTGGFLAAYVLPAFGWRVLFVFAGFLGIAMLCLVWRWLPEPISYLIARPGKDSLGRVNDYLNRCGIPAVSHLPPPPPDAAALPWTRLFRGGMARVTLTIASSYFLYVITLFYMQSWVPALVVASGFTSSQGAMISVCVSFGGIIGGLSLGWATLRFGLKQIVMTALGFGAALTVLFGLLSPSLMSFAVTAAFAGFFLFGGMIGLYAIIARSFPAHIRATGTGLVIGVGRLGALLGPALAGLLFSTGMVRSLVSMLMAAPALLAMILLSSSSVRSRATP